MNEKRTVVTLFGVGVAVVTAYIAYRFIAALTIAVSLLLDAALLQVPRAASPSR